MKSEMGYSPPSLILVDEGVNADPIVLVVEIAIVGELHRKSPYNGDPDDYRGIQSFEVQDQSFGYLIKLGNSQ